MRWFKRSLALALLVSLLAGIVPFDIQMENDRPDMAVSA